MQALPGQRPVNNVRGTSRAIVVIAFLLFALAGLMSGFAVGAFVRTNPIGQGTTGEGATAIPNNANTPKSTPKQRPTFLGIPSIESYADPEVANGTTMYTLSAQAIDKKTNNPVHASDITCKLWLVKRIPDHAILTFPDISRLQNVGTLTSPLSGQAQGRTFNEISQLQFSSATAQTQFCNANGQGKWEYTINPSLDPGEYDLVVLTDWAGVHYNWSWANIKIKKGD